MIGVKLQGRLGNQLFQYAFAYATAKKLNTTFYIDQSLQKLVIQKYFDIPSTFTICLENYIFNIKGLHNFFSHTLMVKFYQFLSSGKMIVEFDWYTNQIKSAEISEIKDKTLFKGYFQSEIFFTNYEQAIRKLFNVKKHLKSDYHKKYSGLFNGKKIITVHIRKTDYANFGSLNLGGEDLSLPLSYYHELLNSLQAENILYVFISDDILSIKTEFAYLSNKYISNDTVINDFQHLLNADICVIANSSFSWWGAWLNNKRHKKIYAPKHYMGHVINKTLPENIYPNDWELISVN